MSGADMGSGAAVTLDAAAVSTAGAWRELAGAFGMKDETARFRGALQVFAAEQDGDALTWRTIGSVNGVYSAITAISDARFLLTHPGVVKVRVLRFSEVTD